MEKHYNSTKNNTEVKVEWGTRKFLFSLPLDKEGIFSKIIIPFLFIFISYWLGWIYGFAYLLVIIFLNKIENKKMSHVLSDLPELSNNNSSQFSQNFMLFSQDRGFQYLSQFPWVVKDDGTLFYQQVDLIPAYENKGGDSTGDKNIYNMEIKSQEIKQLNITAVFSEIDHTSITAEKMRKIFELSEEEKKNSPFLEPSQFIKILGIPNRRKDIIIEGKRLRVNDSENKEPQNSELLKYFQIAFKKLTDKDKLIAYGFNYDILVTYLKKIDFKKFLGKNVIRSLSTTSILESGLRVLFTKKGKRYNLQISPTGDPHKLLFHLNAHYPLKKIGFQQLQKQFEEDYLCLIRIIEKN